jgi:hypothetical protein
MQPVSAVDGTAAPQRHSVRSGASVHHPRSGRQARSRVRSRGEGGGHHVHPSSDITRNEAALLELTVGASHRAQRDLQRVRRRAVQVAVSSNPSTNSSDTHHRFGKFRFCLERTKWRGLKTGAPGSASGGRIAAQGSRQGGIVRLAGQPSREVSMTSSRTCLGEPDLSPGQLPATTAHAPEPW